MSAELYSSEDDSTMYIFTLRSGEMVGVVLNHADKQKDGNVSSIMAYSSDDNVTSVAFIAFVGELIDNRFDANDAIEYLYLNKYYETNSLVALIFDPQDMDECVVMATSDFFADDDLEI